MTSAQRKARTERRKAKTPSDAPAQLIALARILARQAVREAIIVQKTFSTVEQDISTDDTD